MSTTPSAAAPPASARAGQLILTVTRACDLRCSYCPTAKDGWPSLSEQDARDAIRLFAGRYGGGDVKLFGGEPLLVPHVVRAALDAAADEPRIRRVYLSTNGRGLDTAWLDRLSAEPKAVLTISMDGRPEDHRRMRRPLAGSAADPAAGGRDTYDAVVSLLPDLARRPRVVITQTIAPATAASAAENFDHLVGLGFRRFNLLPGYYLPWRQEQLAALHTGFREIGARFLAAWAEGRSLYLRNLFTWAPTPFFNTGLVVDADRSIHPSNVGLSGQLDGLRGHTRVGTLDAPPTPEALEEAAQRVPALLAAAVRPQVLTATRAADAELSALCARLYPAWVRSRRGRIASPA